MRPVRGQIDDLLHEIRLRAEKNERVLVTTLTKRMAEDLAEYYTEVGVSAVTFTRKSKPWTASRFCAGCGGVNSMF